MMHPALLTASLLTFLLAVLTLGMVLGVNLGRHSRLYVPAGAALRLPTPALRTLWRLRLTLYVLLLAGHRRAAVAGVGVAGGAARARYPAGVGERQSDEEGRPDCPGRPSRKW